MKKQTEPVFFDRTGNRSLALFAIMGLIIMVLLTFGFLLVPTTLSPETMASPKASGSASEDTVAKIIRYTSSNNTPVIGDGPFVRVVALIPSHDKLSARDPFTGQTYGELTHQEAVSAAGYEYALQKFGQTNSKKSRLPTTTDRIPYTRLSFSTCCRGKASLRHFSSSGRTS